MSVYGEVTFERQDIICLSWMIFELVNDDHTYITTRDKDRHSRFAMIVVCYPRSEK